VKKPCLCMTNLSSVRAWINDKHAIVLVWICVCLTFLASPCAMNVNCVKLELQTYVYTRVLMSFGCNSKQANNVSWLPWDLCNDRRGCYKEKKPWTKTERSKGPVTKCILLRYCKMNKNNVKLSGEIFNT
jgi:hypothetical protein